MEYDLKTLATRAEGQLEGEPMLAIRGVAGVEDAGPGDLTFVSHVRYLPTLADSGASGVIVQEGIDLPAGTNAIRVPDAYVGFLKVLELFEIPRAKLFPAGIQTGAFVDSAAELGPDVHVGAGAVVSAGCRIGRGSAISAGAILLDGVVVGEGCLIYPRVVIREGCILGDRVILQPGAVIGSDGFGYAELGDGSRRKIPQVGIVELQDDVEVGANCAIDRATTGRTLIGRGSKIDNLVQVGHNVRLGEDGVLCSQVGISGSTRIGNRVILAGQVGVNGHIEVGDDVHAAGKTGITKGLKAGSIVAGLPARDHHEWRRQMAHQGRLARYAAELGELRERLARLESERSASPTKDSGT